MGLHIDQSLVRWDSPRMLKRLVGEFFMINLSKSKLEKE